MTYVTIIINNVAIHIMWSRNQSTKPQWTFIYIIRLLTDSKLPKTDCC